LETATELCGVKEGDPRVDDLEKHFHEVKRKSAEMNEISSIVYRTPNVGGGRETEFPVDDFSEKQ
jgi:hypothetical protein